MAVYTDVPEDALEKFIALYDIGGVLSFKGIAEGVENSNFLLHTEGGYFILTLYEKRVKKEDLPFFIGLMDHLAMRGINCPRPVRMKNGETLGELQTRPAAIVTFLEGMGIARPAAHHCREVGEALAKLHLAGQDYKTRRVNALSVQGWRPLFDAAKNLADFVTPGLSDATAASLQALEAEWPKDLPQGVIHADLFTDNVFFLKDKLSGVIDFYFACSDFLAYDLAICLNAWCFELDGSFNITKGQAMIAGYRAIRDLEPREVEALPVLCRGASLRFMLTRLVDWLNVPPGALVRPKDPLEYYRKLRFFEACRNARDYGY
ncbi:MAG: homoserine kinase [Alphaproteobacteria bacterium]|nr:homoserine kinase [Alphaproteobacteria bacterium]